MLMTSRVNTLVVKVGKGENVMLGGSVIPIVSSSLTYCQ
jgi:hypothetical protein